MSRPGDITQEVWDAAIEAAGPVHCFADVVERIARAILTAKAEEREACAEAALNIGNFGDYRRDELTFDFGQPRYDMMMSIVAAIRKRGEG